MKIKTRNAPSRATAMLEVLRGLGYSTAAALADIVDNGISAGASEIRITFTHYGVEIDALSTKYATKRGDLK